MIFGNFDTYIVIQKKERSKNSFGEESFVWFDFVECWSQKYQSTPSEFIQGNQKVSIVPATFSIYHEDNLDETMRIYEPDENKYYAIEGIRYIGNKEGIQLISLNKSSNNE